MAGGTPRQRNSRAHFSVRGCQRFPGSAAPARETEDFAQLHDLLSRTRARDAGRTVVSRLRHSFRQPVSALGANSYRIAVRGGSTRHDERNVVQVGPMPLRIVPDEDKPSVAIEIPLEKALPDYDLEQVDQPTPRDVDAILGSQGFRDLVDDARGVLMDLFAHRPIEAG